MGLAHAVEGTEFQTFYLSLYLTDIRRWMDGFH